MDILRKVANRLSQISLLQTPVLWTEETLRRSAFQTQRSARQEFEKAFYDCRTPEDYFNFAERHVGSHQIKTEILQFIDFVAASKPELICEIGTASGGTNFLLSQSIPGVKLMIGVDLFVRNQFKLKYFAKSERKFAYVNGSSYCTKTVQKVSQILGDRKLDLLFIDGDHHYEGVKKDFLFYKDYVKEGGLIAFHDIVPDYQTRYGKKTLRWAGGVPVLWKELKERYKSVEFIEDLNQDSYGIGVIYYSSSIQFPTT